MLLLILILYMCDLPSSFLNIENDFLHFLFKPKREMMPYYHVMLHHRANEVQKSDLRRYK